MKELQSLIVIFALTCVDIISLQIIDAQTTLLPGDMAVMAVNTQNSGGTCGGSGGEDRISFVFFKDIEIGTELDLTDNGYQRLNPDQFADTEGVLRFTFAQAIPAGEVVTLVSLNNGSYVSPSHPGFFDNPPMDLSNGASVGSLNFNTSGDQMFFMQGGDWIDFTGGGQHDAIYTGNILFGFNSTSTWTDFANSTQDSGLHPQIDPCYHMEPTSSASRFMKYNGSMSPATQLQWIDRIRQQSNWDELPTCDAYNTSPPFYETPLSIPILPSEIELDCVVCNDCNAFNDVLIFNLPTSPTEFVVTYTDGVNQFTSPMFDNHTINVSISSNTTYEILSIQDAQGCPVYSNIGESLTFEISPGPIFNNPGTQMVCGSYTLPAITGSGLTGGEQYFTGPNGTGTSLVAGQILTNTSIIYIFDPSDNCSAEESFTVSINSPPSLQLINVPSSCVGSSLFTSDISVIDVSGNGLPISFYSALPTISGNQIASNTPIFTNTTLYAYSGMAGCEDVLPISITFTVPPNLQILSVPNACIGGSIMLTDIIVIDINGTGAQITYHTSLPASIGNQLSDNTVFSTATTIFANSVNGNCFDNEQINLEFNPSPELSLVFVPDVCEGSSIMLEEIIVQDINSTGSPITFHSTIPATPGNQYPANQLFSSDITIFAHSEDIGCIDNLQIYLDFIPPPQLELVNIPEACAGSSIFISDIQVVDLNASSFPITFHSQSPVSADNQLISTDFISMSGIYFAYAGNQVCNDIVPIDINFSSTASATISNGTSICQGDLASVEINFSENGTHQITLMIGEDETSIIETTDNPYTHTAIIDIDTEIGIASYIFGNCNGSISGLAEFEVTPHPTVAIDAPSSACEGELFDVIINFTGDPPFEFQHNINSIAQNPITTNELSYTITTTIDENTSFNITSISSGECDINSNASANISYNEVPIITPVSLVCNQSNDAYTVNFQINGGQAPYTVSGGGILSGSMFMSEEIDSGEGFLFQVADDNNCTSTSYFGQENCDCNTYSGSLDLNPSIIHLCNDEDFIFVHNGDQILESDDELYFILHDGDAFNLGDILGISTSSIFMKPSNAINGMSYFVNAVATNNDNGSPNFNNVCLSQSQGLEVTWHSLPMVAINAPISACPEEVIEIEFIIEGTPPFNLQYQFDSEPIQTITTNDNSVFISQNINNDLICTVVSIEDQYCENIGTNHTVGFLPNLSITQTNYICNDIDNTYQVEFILEGQEPFMVEGVEGVLSENVFISNPIPSNQSYQSTISHNNNCNTDIEVQGTYDCSIPCTSQVGNISLTNTILCNEEALTLIYDATNQMLDDNDQVNYIIASNSSDWQNNILLQSSNSNIFFDNAIFFLDVEYYLLAIVGSITTDDMVNLNDICLSSSIAVPFVWTEFSYNISIDSINLCEGSCTDITIEQSGQPVDFTFDLSQPDGTVTEHSSIGNSSIVINVCPTFDGQYIANNFSNITCPGSSEEIFFDIYIQQPLALIYQSIDCNISDNTYVYELTIGGGVPPYIAISSGTGTINDNIFTSDPIPSGLSQNVTFQDSGVCEDITFNTIHNCDCNNQAAVIDTDSNVCIENTQIINIQILAPSELLNSQNELYYLHQNPIFNSEEIVLISSNGQFDLSTTTTSNSTLYITAIGGVLDGSGEIDFTSSCIVYSNTTQINLIPSPGTPQFEIPSSICETECLEITVTLEDSQAQSLMFEINNTLLQLSNSSNSNLLSFNLCPQELGLNAGDQIVVNYLSIDGAICSNDFEDLTETYPILGNQVENIMQTVCPEFQIIIDGETFDINNQSGQVIQPNASLNGCDIITNVELSFHEPSIENMAPIICPGESIVIAGITFDQNHLNDEIIIPNASPNNCNHTIIVNTQLEQVSTTTIEIPLCIGETTIIDGQILSIDNPIHNQLLTDLAFTGCDSITTFQVINLLPSTNTVNETLFEGEHIEIEGQIFDQNNPIGEIILQGANYQGCDSVINVNLQFETAPAIYLTSQQPSCFGDTNGSITIDSVVNYTLPFELILGDNREYFISQLPYQINGLPGSNYHLQLIDADNTITNLEVFVKAPIQYQLSLGEDQNILMGESTQIIPQTNMASIDTFIWTPTNYLDTLLPFAPQVILPLETTIYTLTLIDDMGCEISQTIVVRVNQDINVFIPTSFSPNNDGINDRFTLFARNQVDLIKSLKVFDRWGNQIFENINFSPNHLDSGWDGTSQGHLMNSGVYIYQFELLLFSGRSEIITGDISLFH